MHERNVSTKSSPVWLFEVSANDVHQFIRPFARVVPIFRFQHVMAQMSFHQLCHQAVHASASSSDQLQYFGAIGPFLQGSFDGGHLSREFASSGQSIWTCILSYVPCIDTIPQ